MGCLKSENEEDGCFDMRLSAIASSFSILAELGYTSRHTFM
jgi:hypothetical protein